MIQKQNQVPSALKLLVVLTSGALAEQARAAETQDVLCDRPTGCYYGASNKYNSEANDHPIWIDYGDYRTWIDEHNHAKLKDIEAENIRVRVKPQHYENLPATHSGYRADLPVEGQPTHYSLSSNHVIGMSGSGKSRPDSELIVPSGTSVTLSEDYEDSSAVYISATKATLEKGVTLTVNPGYAEKHNIDIKQFDKWGDINAGSALSVNSFYDDNSAYVKTSADMVLNGKGSAGIDVHGKNSTVEVSDAQITLNAGASVGIANDNNGTVRARNINIVSGRSLSGPPTWENAHVGLTGSNFVLENSTVNLSPQHMSLGVLLWDEAPDTAVEIRNSNISARYGFAVIGDEDEVYDSVVHLDNSTIRGHSALLVANPKEISEQDFAYINGNLEGNITFNARNSELYGKIELNRQKADAPQSRNLALNLRDNSTWTLNGDSELDKLNVAGSQVVFEKGNAFKTLTLHGDLSGNGTFALHTDIAAGQGDKLQVKGKVSGSHVLQIEDSQNEPKSEQQALTVVESGGGDGTFKLSGDYVDAGTFRYRLSKQGGNWALTYATRREKSQVTDSKNTGTSLPVGNVPDTAAPNNNGTDAPSAPESVLPEPRILSAYAGQSLAHIQAAVQNLQQQHDTLNLRLADLHSAGYLNGFWMEGENGETHTHGRAVGHHAHSSSFRQVRNAYQIGYDRRLANGYLGVLAGRSRSNLRYRDGLYADSSLKTDTFAVYGGVSSDDWFADGVWRHNRHKANGAAGIDRFRSDSLTVQGGRNIPLSEHWYITPQATLTAAYVSGGRYADKSLLLQSRAGADLNGWFPVGHGVLKPSFGVHYVGDHRRAGMTFNGNSFSVPRSGSRVAVRGGLAMDFGTYNSLNINLQTEYGKHMRRLYTIGIGYRRTW